MFGIFLNALGAVVLGGVGWFALEFFGRPIRTFFDLRRQINAEVLRFNTAVTKSYINSQKEAGAALVAVRNLSADLTSFGEAEWLANCFLQRIGFYPAVAGERFANFASGSVYLTDDQIEDSRAGLRALKLNVPKSGTANWIMAPNGCSEPVRGHAPELGASPRHKLDSCSAARARVIRSLRRR
jgi:hypothetical protein